MKVSFDIPAKRIADLMVTAIEGNHMTRSWCEGVYLDGRYKGKEDAFASPWYSDPKL